MDDKVMMEKGISRLTISSVDAIPIRVPLGRTYRGSHYQMTHRSTVICRVTTEQGVVGEAWAGDEDAGLDQIVAIIREEIGPALLHGDCLAVERCWQLARPATNDILRDRRLGLVACACVDSAIWDAVGKTMGQPLWRLWGGFRDRLPMMCIGGYYNLDPIEEEAERFRELGVRAVKFKVGGLSPEEDARRVAVLRNELGPAFKICVDANQGWSPMEALAFARRIADLDITWFEEPCHWANDRRAMRDVRLRGGLPVCAGQSEYSTAGCRDLMEQGAIDVCNFDASWSGGPTEWRRTAAVAVSYDVEMGHHEEPQVASHLLASIPHGTMVECFDPDRDPIWWNLPANRPELEDGELALPENPGLGWELDREYVDHYRVG